jgi:ABC-type multidrug transport system fused ATPase/permease subunit
MKSKLLAFILVIAVMYQSGYSVNTVKNLVPGNGTEQQISTVKSNVLSKAEAKSIQKLERKEFRTQKRLAMVQRFMAKKMAKKAIDFQDPVNKWLGFGVFGWGAGLLLWIIAGSVFSGGIGLLASLCWLFGTVSFVIWLVKKFGNA